MKKSEEELSIKMLNNEFKRVFAQPLGIRETALRLRECIDGIDDDFTEVDNFKLSFEAGEVIALITFEAPFDDEKMPEYKQKSVIFEEKIRDENLSFLKLNILDTYNVCNPSSGFIVWNEYSDTNGIKLLQTIQDWKAKYENIVVIIFQYEE